MKVLFKQCMECDYGFICLDENFERCYRIERVAHGLGIPVKQKNDNWTKLPFGVFKGLQHIIKKIEEENISDSAGVIY